MQKTSYLLDLAIAYALLGFIGIIFTAVFLLEKIKTGDKAIENRRRDNYSYWRHFCSIWSNRPGKVRELLQEDFDSSEN